MDNIIIQYVGVSAIALIAIIWIVVKVYKAVHAPSAGCSSCPLSSGCAGQNGKTQVKVRLKDCPASGDEKK